MERLELPFELRQKSRLRARLASGEEVRLMLARGTVMRGGDVVTTIDGREVEIVAAKEKLLHIESDHLARVAYHLGNRHVPVQPQIFARKFAKIVFPSGVCVTSG